MPASRTSFLLLLVTALGWATPAEALRFRVINAPPPMLLLSVGSGGSHIDRVSFKIKSNELGNGVPVGVVTAMIGGPFFLWLLVRKG